MTAARTHAELVHAAHWWLRGSQRHPVVLSEIGSWYNGEFPDVIGWRTSGFCTLVECKTTESDFEADRRKESRREPGAGMGEHRWYFVEPGVIRPGRLLAGWGLAELRGDRVFRVVHPKPFPFRDVAAEARLLISAVDRATTRWMIAGRLQQGRGLRVFGGLEPRDVDDQHPIPGEELTQ